MAKILKIPLDIIDAAPTATTAPQDVLAEERRDLRRPAHACARTYCAAC